MRAVRMGVRAGQYGLHSDISLPAERVSRRGGQRGRLRSPSDRTEDDHKQGSERKAGRREGRPGGTVPAAPHSGTSPSARDTGNGRYRSGISVQGPDGYRIGEVYFGGFAALLRTVLASTLGTQETPSTPASAKNRRPQPLWRHRTADWDTESRTSVLQGLL